MKTSNHKTTKITAYVIIAAIIANLIFVLFAHSLKYEILCATSISFLTFLIFRIKCITYDFSGGCITIRKHHPFVLKKFIVPYIEFPQEYIQNFQLEYTLGFGVLILHIKSKRNRKFKVKASLTGFSNYQIKSLRSSLTNIISKSYNQVIENSKNETQAMETSLSS